MYRALGRRKSRSFSLVLTCHAGRSRSALGFQHALFPHLHGRSSHVVFAIETPAGALQTALRTAIGDSEVQARYVRKIRRKQAAAFETFAETIHARFGILPEQSGFAATRPR
jgi:hypothetical protein